MKLEFSRHIFEKSSKSKFHQNPYSGSRVVPCGRTDVVKLIVAFRNVANAPKNWNIKILKYSKYVDLHVWEWIGIAQLVQWLGCELDCRGLNLGGIKSFLSSPRCLDHLWGSPGFLLKWVPGSFPACFWSLTPFSAEIKNEWSCTSAPPRAFTEWTGTIVPLYWWRCVYVTSNARKISE
jgi:hypothetical protein